MRLLNVSTLRLETFNGAEEDIPPYAILSHTWDTKELVFEDLRHQPLESFCHLPQYCKVKRSCLQAAIDGFSHLWIDTCCIDKTSSSELSEAINSMFKWYQQSSICYVYLKDFEVQGCRQLRVEEFCASQWFERGWTLQELIAPRKVAFFDKHWTWFGSRDDNSLFGAICQRSRVLPQVFTTRHCMCPSALSSATAWALLRNGMCRGCNAKDNLPDLLGSLHAAVVMNWAAQRSTTRAEDAAYSLIGLFNVNLPLLYGEGLNRAFFRLQSAILSRNNDHSLLLWRVKRVQGDSIFSRPGCISLAPLNFEGMLPIVPQREYYDFDNEMVPRLAAGLADSMEPIELSDTLVEITLWVCPCAVDMPHQGGSRNSLHWEFDLALGILNCHDASDYVTRPAILLSHVGGGIYRRIAHDSVFFVNPRRLSDVPSVQTFSMYKPRETNTSETQSPLTLIRQLDLPSCRQRRIKLLVRPSGPSLWKKRPSKLDQLSSSTDAVCLVINQHPLHGSNVRCRILGGYPRMYSSESFPTTMPILRSLVKYRCDNGVGLVGGIHLLRLECSMTPEDRASFPEAPTLIRSAATFYVVWGMYHGQRRGDGYRHVQEPATMTTWCRIFGADKFAEGLDAPPPVSGQDEMIFQKQLHAWLVKRSARPEWSVRTNDGAHRAVLPDLSSGWEAEADRVLDLFPEFNARIGLSARMRIVQGFGVTANDVELTVLTPSDRGWQGNYFDGGPGDQEPLRGVNLATRLLHKGRRGKVSMGKLFFNPRTK